MNSLNTNENRTHNQYYLHSDVLPLLQICKVKKKLNFLVFFVTELFIIESKRRLFCLDSDALGGLWWIIEGIGLGTSFLELSYMAPCIAFSCLCNTKSFFLLHCEDYVCDLIDDMLKLEASGRDGKETEEKIEIRKRETKFLSIIIKSSNILNSILLFFFSMGPMILLLVKFLSTGEFELNMPFPIKYPFDSDEMKYRPFVYVHQVLSTCVVISHICGADYLLYISCTYLRIQFRMLQSAIRNVILPNNELTPSEAVIFEEKLIDLIKWHQELIRLTSQLELIFTKPTLYNFISSSILLCLTGFNFMAVQSITYTFAFLVFLSASMLQIYLLCFFGDLLMDSSMEVCNAVYESKWYNVSAKSAMSLLIMQTRAQKPCKLTAYGFSDVNLMAFMSISSTAWSYFALLKTVYSPSE